MTFRPPIFTCPRCHHAVSYSTDTEEAFCARCGIWMAEVWGTCTYATNATLELPAIDLMAELVKELNRQGLNAVVPASMVPSILTSVGYDPIPGDFSNRIPEAK